MLSIVFTVISSLNKREKMRFVKSLNFRIFILSALMLFLELFLIRWISTEIRIFAYVSNLVLLACFIGMGAGCYFSGKKTNPLFSFLMLAIVALAVKSAPFRIITDLLGVFDDSLIWSQQLSQQNFIPALQGIGLTLLMFVMLASIFFPLGQLLARMFVSHNKIIVAYSVNILGSIAGIWLFSMLSFVYTTPLIWLIFSFICGLFFIEKRPRSIFLFLGFLLVACVIISLRFNNAFFTLWSPYQKLDVYPIRVNKIDMGYTVNVNNTNYMEILNMSSGFIRDNKDIFGPYGNTYRRFGQYEIPYIFKDRIKDVLIVGAGAGNDAAGALRAGMQNIDAVEIDPGIYRLGSMLHPERPYEDSRINIHIDDARSFFKKTRNRYDVISFGLLDSHTVSSSYNNIRLDHYIYTLEGFKEARALLRDDGIMTVAFAATRHWIAVKLRGLIKDAFGEEPIYFTISPYGSDVLNRGWIMYVVGNDMDGLKRRIRDNPDLNSYIKNHSIEFEYDKKIKLTTDDWPYFYIEKQSIPKMYLCIILSLLVLFAVLGTALFSGGKHLDLHFVFLGAGFLLLEFQNVSKASLLFGSTWLVNAYMITAILALILLANLFARHFKIKNIRIFYYLLWISLVVIYLIPLSSFNIYNYYVKSTVVSILLNVPIFFAGVIFINSFKDYLHKDIALGSNLLGASLGGLLESFSFITGIKTLLLAVLLFYILAFIFNKKARLSP